MMTEGERQPSPPRRYPVRYLRHSRPRVELTVDIIIKRLRRDHITRENLKSEITRQFFLLSVMILMQLVSTAFVIHVIIHMMKHGNSGMVENMMTRRDHTYVSPIVGLFFGLVQAGLFSVAYLGIPRFLRQKRMIKRGIETHGEIHPYAKTIWPWETT